MADEEVQVMVEVAVEEEARAAGGAHTHLPQVALRSVQAALHRRLLPRKVARARERRVVDVARRDGEQQREQRGAERSNAAPAGAAQHEAQEAGARCVGGAAEQLDRLHAPTDIVKDVRGSESNCEQDSRTM